MKKHTYVILLLLLPIVASFSCSNLQNFKLKNEQKTDQMRKIEFIPEEFNDVKLGYYETQQSVSFLQFPNGIPINTITISTPDKIICDLKNKDFTPVIPICAIHLISLKRGLKYNDLSAMMLHIRKLDEKIVYSGEIVDKELKGEHPILSPGHTEAERLRIEMVKEAQKYSDDELDLPGLFEGNFLNINLMEYVNIPFEPGRYEVYLSFCGLESNHTIVEIVEK